MYNIIFFNIILQAFSISEIYGAFCDAGQNYKNLVGFVKGLGKWLVQCAVIVRLWYYNFFHFLSIIEVNFDQKTVFGCREDF